LYAGRECLTKFGEKLGREVWNAVNEVFDVMPLAAVIDKKVLMIIDYPYFCIIQLHIF